MLVDVLFSSGPEPGSTAEIEARQALERAIRSNPFSPNSHTLLGKLLIRKKETSAAFQEFKTALQYDPANRTTLYQLALALRKAGKSEEAEKAFQQFRNATKQLLQTQPTEERVQIGSIQSTSASQSRPER